MLIWLPSTDLSSILGSSILFELFFDSFDASVDFNLFVELPLLVELMLQGDQLLAEFGLCHVLLDLLRERVALAHCNAANVGHEIVPDAVEVQPLQVERSFCLRHPWRSDKARVEHCPLHPLLIVQGKDHPLRDELHQQR